jgi:hypothetical protein
MFHGKRISDFSFQLNERSRSQLVAPIVSRATTSHIERQNLTVRMSMRRMIRLTNAFSKKWMNLKHAYSLQFAYYNFCRPHTSLQKCTPAMAGWNCALHVWAIEKLITWAAATSPRFIAD